MSDKQKPGLGSDALWDSLRSRLKKSGEELARALQPDMDSTALLRARRALALAQSPESRVHQRAQQSVLDFEFEAMSYRIEASYCQAILEHSPVTPLPGGDTRVLGLVNCLGSLVPVFRSGSGTGEAISQAGTAQAILVLGVDRPELGLQINGSPDLLDSPGEESNLTPVEPQGILGDGVIGMDEDSRLLLSGEALLCSEELNVQSA